MRVVGFNFKQISVEKNKEVTSDSKLRMDIEIKDIQEQKTELFGDKDVINFEYEFNLLYEPDVAKLNFKGGLLMLIEDKELVKEINESWKKDKKIPNRLLLPMRNLILSRCHLKALQLEEDLNLPQHTPPPRLVTQPKEGIINTNQLNLGEKSEEKQNNKEIKEKKEPIIEGKKEQKKQ